MHILLGKATQTKLTHRPHANFDNFIIETSVNSTFIAAQACALNSTFVDVANFALR